MPLWAVIILIVWPPVSVAAGLVIGPMLRDPEPRGFKIADAYRATSTGRRWS